MAGHYTFTIDVDFDVRMPEARAYAERRAVTLSVALAELINHALSHLPADEPQRGDDAVARMSMAETAARWD